MLVNLYTNHFVCISLMYLINIQMNLSNRILFRVEICQWLFVVVFLSLKCETSLLSASSLKGYPCTVCNIELNSVEQYQAHISGSKHKNQWVSHAAFLKTFPFFIGQQITYFHSNRLKKGPNAFACPPDNYQPDFQYPPNQEGLESGGDWNSFTEGYEWEDALDVGCPLLICDKLPLFRHRSMCVCTVHLLYQLFTTIHLFPSIDSFCHSHTQLKGPQ